MADPRPPRKDMDVFVHQVNSLKKKQRVSSTPTGTQRFRSVEQLQAAIARLETVVEEQQEQLEFLQAQTVSEWLPVSSTVVPVSADDEEVPFDPLYDVSIDVDTTDSGQIIAQYGGLVWQGESGVAGYVVEVVGEPGGFALFNAIASPFIDGVTAITNVAMTKSFSLAPNTSYTVRTRRFYSVGSGTSSIQYAAPWLTVTRIR